jgi:hypothetical protein
VSCTLPAPLRQIFLAVFTLEMSLKIVALGFIMKPGAYLRDSVGHDGMRFAAPRV